jgi:prevent-host-death family protein
MEPVMKQHNNPLPRSPSPAGGLPAWKLEDAKARFSEVVRLAREKGPQRVTVRGQEAVVVVSAADYARLAPAATSAGLMALFAESPFGRLESFGEELPREPATFREAPEF